jgi:Ca2+/Na+ antiporter
VVCPVANAVGACVLTWVCCVIGMLSVTAAASTRQASGTTMSRKTRMRRQCWLAHTAALSAKRSATVEVCHECLAFWCVEHHGTLSHAQCDVCVMYVCVMYVMGVCIYLLVVEVVLVEEQEGGWGKPTWIACYNNPNNSKNKGLSDCNALATRHTQ